MLTYEPLRGFEAIWMVLNLRGSFLPKATKVAALSVCIALAFRYTRVYVQADWYETFLVLKTPFGFSIFGSLLGFAAVFRASMAMGRYNEGIKHFEIMTMKYLDSFSLIMSFVNSARQKHRENREVLEKLELLKEILAHWYTLLSAICVIKLKCNSPEDAVPPIVCRQVREHVIQGEDIYFGTRFAKKLAEQGVTNPSPHMGEALKRAPRLESALSFSFKFYGKKDYNDVHRPGIGGSPEARQRIDFMDAIEVPYVNERLMMQLSSDEKDYSEIRKTETGKSIDFRDREILNEQYKAKKRMELEIEAATVMTPRDGTAPKTAAAAKKTNEDLTPFKDPTTDAKSANTDESPMLQEFEDMFYVEILGPFYQEELCALARKTDRTHIIGLWINTMILHYQKKGWINVGPPILGRVSTELSLGLASAWEAHKIAFIPFPFPFAQLLQLMLTFWVLTLPVVIAQYTGDYMTCGFLTFFSICALWGLHLISGELENPYGEDTNDLPLLEMHIGFVDSVQNILMQGRCDDKFGNFMMPFFLPEDGLNAEVNADIARQQAKQRGNDSSESIS